MADTHKIFAPYLHPYEATKLEEEDDFPRTQNPVYVLGTSYSALHELDDIYRDISSRLWFTYRWGFAAIGGDGPSSDQGWGCMLRCGQMLMAQALLNLHLGRDWRWNIGKNDSKYYRILKMFLDKRDQSAVYSIHQIANMGASDGRQIGEWFGPNTVAQVLKKLAIYDEWSDIRVHVALDNTVIKEDLKTLATCHCTECVKCEKDQDYIDASSLRDNKTRAPAESHTQKSHVMGDHTSENVDDFAKLSLVEQAKKHKLEAAVNLFADSPSVLSCNMCERCSLAGSNVCNCQSKRRKHFKPILLIIPLRLGLSDINPVYINSLKFCFAIKQSIGIIGGKPNQAHWFIGTVEDELIYLDPHTCQAFDDITKAAAGADESYHCPYRCRMNVSEIDPSLAVAFFCSSERELSEMFVAFQKYLICSCKTPLFEVHEKRPAHWPEFEPYETPRVMSSPEFVEIDDGDTEEGFVML